MTLNPFENVGLDVKNMLLHKLPVNGSFDYAGNLNQRLVGIDGWCVLMGGVY